MKSVWLGTVALATLILAVSIASTQPPPGAGPRDKKGGPPPGGPPRFELGRVLPPPLIEELELTENQRVEIDKLEKEVRDRLSRILTAEQRKKVENFRPRGPGGPGGPPRGGPDRPGRPDGDNEKSGRPKRPQPPDRPDKDEARNTAGGIQWYATWESGLRAAQDSGRPILLVSAAPHCAGVSGTW